MRLYAIVHFGEKKTYYNLKERVLQHKLSPECLGDKDTISGHTQMLTRNSFLDPRYMLVPFDVKQMTGLIKSLVKRVK